MSLPRTRAATKASPRDPVFSTVSRIRVSVKPGLAQVDLVPALREALSVHKTETRFGALGDLVFPTESGCRQDRNNARRRVVIKSVERASENLIGRGLNPLPEGITPHSLRRTFISLLLATGAEVPYVMRQVGHSDPKVTLSIYAQVMYRGEGERERLKAVVESTDWALTGTDSGPMNGPMIQGPGRSTISQRA